MLLPTEVIAALLATFTATRITQHCRIAHSFVRSLWVALPLGRSEGSKGSFAQPKLSIVQFGGQSLFRDEEGREALNEVVKVLVIGLLNIFVFEVLSFALERSLNPLPAACVFFACIAKLWILQLRLLRLNLIYRYDKFQRLLPLVFVFAVGLAGVVCLPELSIHRDLQLQRLNRSLQGIVRHWARELDIPNTTLFSSDKCFLLVEGIICFFLLLFGAAAAPTIEEAEDLKEISDNPSKYINAGLLKAVGEKTLKTKLLSLSSFFNVCFILLLLPPVFEFFCLFINSALLRYLHLFFGLLSLIFRVFSCKTLVQASLLHQSNNLASLLSEDSNKTSAKTNKEREELMKEIQCVSLANRTAATRAAEVLLLPTLLLLLLFSYTLFYNPQEVKVEPPAVVRSFSGLETKTNLNAATAAATAAAVCSRPTPTAPAAAATAAAAAECCEKNSMLEEVLCPVVLGHFNELRLISAKKEKKKNGKEEEISFFSAAHTPEHTQFQEETARGVYTPQIKYLLGPCYSVFKPILLLFRGDKLQKQTAAALLQSLNQTDAINWFRFSLSSPPVVTKDLFVFLNCLLFQLLFISSFAFTFLSIYAFIKTRREGPSCFSVWGPEVNSSKMVMRKKEEKTK